MMLRTGTVIPAASSENISVGWVTDIFLSIIWVFLSEANPSGVENLIIGFLLYENQMMKPY